MKVFLTGATGFGRPSCGPCLAANGAKLRMLVRKTSNLANLEGIPATRTLATLPGRKPTPRRSPPAMLWSTLPRLPPLDSRSRAMYRANVEGTRDLLKLARDAGIKRFVYTSSVATMHFRRDGMVINEDTPVSLRDMVGHYKRSQVSRRTAGHCSGCGRTARHYLNPTTPSAPTTPSPRPQAHLVVDFLNGRFPAYMDTGLNLVDWAGVARAPCLRTHQGQSGIATFSAAKPNPQADSRKMAAITGLRRPL